MRKVGDKEAVYYGEAEHTPGGLRRSDLMINGKGKIVSAAQHQSGLERVKNLHAGGARTRAAKKSGHHRMPAHGGFSWPHIQGHINPVYLHQMDQGTYHIPTSK